MPTNLVTIILQYLSPLLIDKIAKATGLDRSLVEKALNAIIPGILGNLGKAAGKPGGVGGISTLIGALDPDTLTQLGNMIGGPNQKELVAAGSDMLTESIGAPAASRMVEALMSFAGVDETAGKGLIGMVAPATLAGLATLQRARNLDANGLGELLISQRDNIAAALPADFGRSLGLLPKLDVVSSVAATASGAVAAVNAAKAVAMNVAPVTVMPDRVAAPIAASVAAAAAAAAASATQAVKAAPTAAEIAKASTAARETPKAVATQASAAPPIAAEVAKAASSSVVHNPMTPTKAAASIPAVAVAKDLIDHGYPSPPRSGTYWKWVVPGLVLLVGGLYWLFDSAQKQIAIEAKQNALLADKQRVEALAKAEAEAEAAAQRAALEAKQKAETEAAAAKAKAEADAKQRADAEAAAARARADTEAKAKAEAAAVAAATTKVPDAVDAVKLKAEADARAVAEAEAKVRAEVEAKQRADAAAAAQAGMAAEAKAKADAEAKRRAETDAKARVEAESAAKRKADLVACQASVSTAAASGTLRFTVASADLISESSPTLDRLASAVKACPAAKLRIEGHTDGDGLPERNQALSERRAKAVYEYLQNAGVTADRMTFAGFGLTKPIAPNDSEENKLKNRRIEFIVVE